MQGRKARQRAATCSRGKSFMLYVLPHICVALKWFLATSNNHAAVCLSHVMPACHTCPLPPCAAPPERARVEHAAECATASPAPRGRRGYVCTLSRVQIVPVLSTAARNLTSGRAVPQAGFNEPVVTRASTRAAVPHAPAQPTKQHDDAPAGGSSAGSGAQVRDRAGAGAGSAVVTPGAGNTVSARDTLLDELLGSDGAGAPGVHGSTRAPVVAAAGNGGDAQHNDDLDDLLGLGGAASTEDPVAPAAAAHVSANDDDDLDALLGL